MNELREKLADLEHDRWSRWMRYQFTKGFYESEGSFTLNAISAQRWARQMNTPYSELSEQEKDSDRAEADKTLGLISDHIAALEAENAALKAQLDVAQKDRDEARAVRNVIDEHGDDVGFSLADEIETLYVQIADWMKTADDGTHEIRHLRASRDRWQKRAKFLVEKTREFQTEAALRLIASMLSENKADLATAEVERLHDLLNQAHAERDNARRWARAWKSNAKSYRAAYNARLALWESVQNILSRAHAERDNARDDAAGLREAFVEMFGEVCGNIGHVVGHSTNDQETADIINGQIHAETVVFVERGINQLDLKYGALYRQLVTARDGKPQETPATDVPDKLCQDDYDFIPPS